MKPGLRSLLGLALVAVAAGAVQQWWAARHDARLGAEVAALAGPGSLRMLSSDRCAACALARHWFVRHGVAYGECSIERDPACRAAFDATGAPGTPVLLVKGRAQLGFDPGRVRAALALPS